MRIATLSNSFGRPAWARACAPPHAREGRQFVWWGSQGRAVLPAPAQMRLDYLAAHPGAPAPSGVPSPPSGERGRAARFGCRGSANSGGSGSMSGWTRNVKRRARGLQMSGPVGWWRCSRTCTCAPSADRRLRNRRQIQPDRPSSQFIEVLLRCCHAGLLLVLDDHAETASEPGEPRTADFVESGIGLGGRWRGEPAPDLWATVALAAAPRSRGRGVRRARPSPGASARPARGPGCSPT